MAGLTSSISKINTPKYTTGTPKVRTDAVQKNLNLSSNDFTKFQLGFSTVSGVSSAITGYLNQQNANLAYSQKANNYQAQANALLQNANLQKLELANIHQRGDYQALVQGMQDRQIIASEITRQASSGTVVNQGSNKEVTASKIMNAQINQATIRKNTILEASNKQLEIANTNAQAIIAQGNAEANRILSNTSSLGVGILSGITAFANSYFMTSLGSLR